MPPLHPLVLGFVVALGVGLLIGIDRERNKGDGPTRQAAGLRTFALASLSGAVAIAAGGELLLAAAALLAARSALHRFVLSVMTDEEIRSLLIFAGATLVVLPLLPDHPIGPYGALNLRTIWIVVILVMAVSALGYIAVRLVGVRFGLPLAGLASGFISSTATIGAMGARAAKEPALLKPAVAGAVLSSVATIVQLAIVIAATSIETLRMFWPPLV